MANSDTIVVDDQGQSATLVSEGLPPDELVDVWFRYTLDGGAFKQGQFNSQFASDENGSLSASVPLSIMRGNFDPAAHASLHMWVHVLPPLTWDENGMPDPNYDHQAGHVLDKGDGNYAEATATIN